MRFLAKRRWRLFLVAWMLYAVHFATNVVREHYPAFSLAERGTLRLDEYQGFHPDIFVHTDSHSYICNNVAVSVLAAAPLFVFDPVLDALERHSLEKLAASGQAPDATYETHHKNRRKFFRQVRERGLDLRFGAATVVTSAFFMAPFSALAVVLMYHVLLLRGLARDRATCLALLFGFGTPIFFRSAHLNHNMFLMHAMFLAFFLLWARSEEAFRVSWRRRFAAGFLAGFCLAADYIGVIIIPLLYGYLLLSRWATASWKKSSQESLAFVAGSVPPVVFLLFTQWSMFGNPFLPAQFWMPVVNYTDRGMRGFSWPSPDLFLKNLFDPTYGMYTYGPLLLLGLIPIVRYASDKLILPKRERLFVVACLVAFLIFCSANQYARMQFNTGFRYLVPLVPFIFLALSDHLVRMPRRWFLLLASASVFHTWVLTMMREPVPDSWRMLFSEGPTLPWLFVLGRTSLGGSALVQHPLVPMAILAFVLLVCGAIWWWGERLEAAKP